MGRDLINEFAFSFSGWKTYRTCARRWWLSKVLFWKGWERTASEEAQLAYRLTKVQSFFPLAGSIVHEIAQDFAMSPRGRSTRQLVDEFAERFERAERESHEGHWQNKPKEFANIFEHYYGHPDAARIRSRAFAFGLKAIDNLTTAPAIRRARRGKVLQAELLQKMTVAGIPVWVQIDLVTRCDDLFWLEDYKTGRPKEEDRMQGLLYALYAVDARGHAPAGVRVALNYLRDGSEDALEPTAEQLDGLRAAIIDAASSMLESLELPRDDEPQLNVGREEDFPGVDDPAVCADCRMFHVCKGTREIPWKAVA